MISFSNDKIKFSLKQSSKIRNWIKTIVSKEKKELGSISYTFVSDEALLKMNKEYLNHNTFTDIITFDYSEKKTISGDIFISIDRIKENAQKFEVEFETELKRVIIHGILHLCGYKDKKVADVKIMRKKEENSLKLFSTL